MAGDFLAPYTGVDYTMSAFWSGWKLYSQFRYNAALSVNHYTTVGSGTFSADTDYNGSAGAVTPQSIHNQDFAWLANNNVAGTVRVWISVDQLMTTPTTTTTNADASLISQTKANVLDVFKQAQTHGLRVIPVLFNWASGQVHTFYAPSITGAGAAWSGAGVSSLSASAQSYLTAMKTLIGWLDADPTAAGSIQYVDLFNEIYFQLSTNTSAGQSQADIQGWLQFLIQAAHQASGNFLYTASQASSWSDASNNLLAVTASNQQAAIGLYQGCDVYDIHMYYTYPPSYTFPVGVKGSGGSGSQLTNATLPAGKTVIDVLKQSYNLPRPWYAGEVGGSVTLGTSYNGYANPRLRTDTWWVQYLANYGCQTVCCEDNGALTDRTQSGGIFTYQPHPLIGVYQAATQASRVQKMIRT